MSFRLPIPRSFTQASILQYAPAGTGVYGISNANEWIYIGEADNIQQSLLEHLAGTGSAVMNRRPTGFVFESCDSGAREALRHQFAREYKPACQQQIPREDNGRESGNRSNERRRQ